MLAKQSEIIVESGTEVFIPLNKLKKSPKNARKTPHSEAAIEAYAASIERDPRPQTPADLDRHNCVAYRLITGGGHFPWKLERDGKEIRIRTSGQLILDDPDLAANLIMEGAGLGLMLEPKASPHLAAGRLVQVLDDWCVPFGGLHLYYPSRHVTPVLRALIDVLKWKPSDPRRA
jgi:DNA-binding transcriptional LysR family regulator